VRDGNCEGGSYTMAKSRADQAGSTMATVLVCVEFNLMGKQRYLADEQQRYQ